jgi:single-strand DNA-binding protein
MNVFNFIGRVGRDAETRYLPNGDAITTWSVAVDSGYGDKKKTSWAKCTLWGKRAESLAQYIRKGDRIGVTGEVSLEEWDGKDGKQSQIAVRVGDVTLLGEKRDEESQRAAQPTPRAKQSADDFEDSIPF